jgi:hypothetical protein
MVPCSAPHVPRVQTVRQWRALTVLQNRLDHHSPPPPHTHTHKNTHTKPTRTPDPLPVTLSPPPPTPYRQTPCDTKDVKPCSARELTPGSVAAPAPTCPVRDWRTFASTSWSDASNANNPRVACTTTPGHGVAQYVLDSVGRPPTALPHTANAPNARTATAKHAPNQVRPTRTQGTSPQGDTQPSPLRCVYTAHTAQDLTSNGSQNPKY